MTLPFSDDMDDMMDISPETAILDGLQNQNLQWHVCLGELIDNAFDAGAPGVDITIKRQKGKSTLVVLDHGPGCDDLSLLVTLGKRRKRSTTKLGRYGIGAKDALLSFGDSVTIESTCAGVYRSLNVNWKNIQRANSWRIHKPSECPSDGPPGLRITVEPLRGTSITTAERKQGLVEKLSKTYTPAIKDGRQITFNGVPIPAYKLPPLEHQKTEDVYVRNKRAHVTMGVTPEGHITRENGLTIAFGYRVILYGQRHGLGSDPTPGLFGWVDLLDGWQLTKNKDNITCDLDALGGAIYRVFRDVIELAARRGQLIRLRGVEDDINRVLREFHEENSPRRRKARRDLPGEQIGTVLPVDSGIRHRRARRTQPGNTFEENAPGAVAGLKVAFDRFGVGGPQAKMEQNIIYLNSDIPLLVQDPARATLVAINVAAFHLATKGDLPFAEDCYGHVEKAMKIAGHLLSKLDAVPIPAEASA
jgi:hypothetical protein